MDFGGGDFFFFVMNNSIQLKDMKVCKVQKQAGGPVVVSGDIHLGSMVDEVCGLMTFWGQVSKISKQFYISLEISG